MGGRDVMNRHACGLCHFGGNPDFSHKREALQLKTNSSAFRNKFIYVHVSIELS